MTWYAAHLVEYFKLRDEVQETYLAFENIVLIEADSVEQGFQEAERMGRENIVEDDTLTVNDKPAICVFGGVRKLVECEDTTQDSTKRPKHGTEVTYSKFEVTEANLQAFIASRSVEVHYLGHDD